MYSRIPATQEREHGNNEGHICLTWERLEPSRRAFDPARAWGM